MHLCIMEVTFMQAAKASGNLDLEKLLDMKEAGIEVESFVSEEMRLQMYQKEVCTRHTAAPCMLHSNDTTGVPSHALCMCACCIQPSCLHLNPAQSSCSWTFLAVRPLLSAP